MPKLDFTKLTPTNHAITSLRDLLKMTVFQDEKLEDILTFVGNIVNGQRLGFIGAMEDVGTKGVGCEPTYKTNKIDASEKQWELGDWDIPLKLCYEDLEGSIAEYTLKAGTEIGDLTSGEYMDYIVLPALEEAMRKMLWRIAWYGDKDANNVTAESSAGVITDGVDIKLFTMADGFWKRLFAIATASPGQKTSISANTAASYAAQKSGLFTKGVATKLFDDIRMNADGRIESLPGAAIFCTKSLADALAWDAKQSYNSIMPWEVLFDGLKVSEWDGTKIISVSLWDRFNKKYQDNGTIVNLPHRAVYTSPENLLLGYPGNDAISDLDIWFDRKERVNYIYSTGKIGTLIKEDDLVHVAY